MRSRTCLMLGGFVGQLLLALYQGDRHGVGLLVGAIMLTIALYPPVKESK